MKIFQLKPLYREKMWGGHKFRDFYHLDVGDGLIGEGWIASSIPGKEDNYVEGLNMSLSQLYQQRNELFGCHPTEIIPIKVMLADCHLRTSLQLHPDTPYAMKHSGSLGKPECAFFLQADEGAIGIYGHNAKTLDEFREMMENGHWNDLIRYYPVHTDDFAYIPAGRVHATCEGTLILEISGNADLTYRVYDFDRLDGQGKSRELHPKQTLDNVLVPDSDNPFEQPEVRSIKGGCFMVYHDMPGEFSVYRLLSKRQCSLEIKEFSFWFIKDGYGTIDGLKVSKGHTYFVPCNSGELDIQGDLDILIASYKEKTKIEK